MEPSAYRSLAFLFSLGSLPIACGPKGGGEPTGGTDGTTDPTGGASTTTTTTTTTGEPTTGGPTTGDPSETAGGDPACAAYVAYYLKCLPEDAGQETELYAYCATVRTRIQAIYGSTCLAAHDALYECLQSSPCDDAEEACADEFAAAGGCLPEASELCVAFIARSEECYGMPAPSYAAGMCQSYINSRAYYAGPPCGAALEEWYACLLDLPCPEFEMQIGCDDLKAAFDLACDNP